jgi:peptidoglycan/LPS O-acetylase OafA/YrhL
MTTYEQHKYHTLDAMRGVAAIAVMIFHFRGMLRPLVGPLGGVESGYLAVDLFFMLSGFVIAHAYDDRLRAGMPVTEFMTLRFIRVLPMIWLGVAIGLAVLVIWPKYSSMQIVAGAVFNLAVLPTPASNRMFLTNGPEWSLFFELVANAVFSALFFKLRGHVLSLLIMGMAVVLVMLAVQHRDLQDGWEWSSFEVGLFRVGFSFALGVRLRRSMASWAHKVPQFPALLILGVAVAGLAMPMPIRYRAFYDLAFVFILSPAMIVFGSRASVNRLAPLCTLLALISFPLYAFHYPVRDAVRSIFEGAPGQGLVAAIIAMVFCLGLSWLLAITYDPWARKRLKLSADRMGLTPARPSLAGGFDARH